MHSETLFQSIACFSLYSQWFNFKFQCNHLFLFPQFFCKFHKIWQNKKTIDFISKEHVKNFERFTGMSKLL